MANEGTDSEASLPFSEQNAPRQLGVTDWSSDHDPEDPHNWSGGKKAYHAAITAAFAFTTYV
jgi:hypothetical protein